MQRWARRPSLVWFGLLSLLMTADTVSSQVTGEIITIAGGAGDGLTALTTNLSAPNGVCVDRSGNLYIADTPNHRVRKVATNGTITTLAGDGFGDNLGFGRFAGDNGPATAASLNAPRGVSVDSLGAVYIADTGNHRIRKVFGESVPASEIESPASLAVVEAEGAIRIEWTITQTATRFGFNVYRSVHPDTGFVKLNDATITGHTQSFAYIDPQAVQFDQPYYYKLETIDISGATKQFGPISTTVPAVATAELYQNAPNPFNPSTTIRFALNAPGKVTFRIYNMLGQEVVTLLNNTPKLAGFDSLSWNGLNSKGESVASGIYVYRLTTDAGFTLSKRLTLLK